MRPPVKIRSMTHADLAAVVSVHRAAFQGFFLDRMGPAFLRGYYTAVLEYEGCISLVALNEAGGVSGFVAGFIDPAGFYAHFRGRRLRLVPAILVALIRRPWLLRGILRNSSRVSDESGGDRSGNHEKAVRTAELASIAVASRGGGVGSLLVHSFVAEARHRKANTVKLTTDQSENDTVRAFYQKHGFVEAGREQRGDRTLVVYAMQLDS